MTTSELITDRAVQIPTWTRGTVLKVWAAAALPMGILAWVVAPQLAKAFSGPTALPQALILCLEQGSLSWPVVKAALWLNGPISPRTGKRDNRLWWMILPLMGLLALEE